MNQVLTWMDYYETDAGLTDCRWHNTVGADYASRKSGDRALQIGIPEIQGLKKSLIPFKLLATDRCNSTVECNDALILSTEEALALESDSMDLVFWPHGPDATEKTQAVLHEIHRVLAPNGLLITTFFNAHGLWQMKEKLTQTSPLPSFTKPQSVATVKKALLEASLTPEAGAYGVYCANTKEEKSNLEKAGDRWWPTMSNLALLTARKLESTPSMVGKVSFNEEKGFAKLSPVSNKVAK